MKHPGRLPLHLQYRFETPGVYEVRYTRKAGQFGPRSADTLFRSSAPPGPGWKFNLPLLPLTSEPFHRTRLTS